MDLEPTDHDKDAALASANARIAELEAECSGMKVFTAKQAKMVRALAVALYVSLINE